MADPLWHTRILCDDGCAGWTVGVVVGQRDPAPLAEALGFDLTVVVAPGGRERAAVAARSDGVRVAPRAGLLAVEAVLRDPASSPLWLRTDAGRVRVTRDEAGRAWVACGPEEPTWGAPLAPLASALGRDPPGHFPERVQTGPDGVRRYYRRVSDPTALEALVLAPERAWSYLRHEGLTEVCLYAEDARDLRLRVFSRRRSGREERAAPRAAPGLVACLEADDPRRAERPLALRLAQGSGPPRQRSALDLRRAPGEGLELSGAVTVLGRGELVGDLGSAARVA